MPWTRPATPTLVVKSNGEFVARARCNPLLRPKTTIAIKVHNAECMGRIYRGSSTLGMVQITGADWGLHFALCRRCSW